jgi:DNA-binding transcriptional LysR family regulator
MDTKYLNTFLTVAKELSFSRAADILNYSQSSVSAHIQSIEEELDTKLFERLGKRVILTEAGKKMIVTSEKILLILDETKKNISDREFPSGTITVGAHESQCAYRIPITLREFRKQIPQVRLIFRPIVSDDNVRSMLCQGILDIAFLLEPLTHHDNLQSLPLVNERIFLIANSEHPLASRSEVAPADLINETILVTEKGCSYRQMFENTLTEAKSFPGATIEFSSIEGIKQCVIAGLGIAVLPEMTVQKEILSGQIVALNWKHQNFLITTQLAWHKDKWLSPALKAFINITKETILSEA